MRKTVSWSRAVSPAFRGRRRTSEETAGRRTSEETCTPIPTGERCWCSGTRSEPVLKRRERRRLEIRTMLLIVGVKIQQIYKEDERTRSSSPPTTTRTPTMIGDIFNGVDIPDDGGVVVVGDEGLNGTLDVDIAVEGLPLGLEVEGEGSPGDAG